jgi:hypothetical protein
VGGAIALAALSTFAFDRVDDAMADAGGDHSALPAALTEGFELGLYLGAGLAVVGALIALLAIGGRDDGRQRAAHGHAVPERAAAG